MSSIGRPPNLSAALVLALGLASCGGKTGSARSDVETEAGDSCGEGVVGWHAVESEPVPSEALASWFAVSAGSRVLGVDGGVSVISLDLETGAVGYSEFDRAMKGTWIHAWTGDGLLLLSTLYVPGTAPAYTPPQGLRYDPVTDDWSLMSVDGQPEYFFCGVWTGSELLVFGGPRVFAYAPESDRWRELAPPEGELGECQAVWTGDHAFVWGTGGSQEEHDIAARFDPGANRWLPTAQDPVQGRRYSYKLGYSDGVVVVWGGVLRLGVEEQPARSWRYIIEDDVWLPVATIEADTWRPADVTENHSPVYVRNFVSVPHGILARSFRTLGGDKAEQPEPVLFYSPTEDEWQPLRDDCEEGVGAYLVWTDRGAVGFWYAVGEDGPIAWIYEGPLP